MQSHADGAVANQLDGAIGHTHLSLDHRIARLVELFGNIKVGHRAKQAAIHTGFLGQLDGGTTQLLTQGLGFSQFGGGGFFKLGAAGFKFCFGAVGGTASQTGRN